MTGSSAPTSTIARDAVLLEWADVHCTKGAAALRAATQPEERTRCLDKLEGLWFTWAYQQMTAAKGWTQSDVNDVIRRGDEREAEGQSPRDAARSAFLGVQEARRLVA